MGKEPPKPCLFEAEIEAIRTLRHPSVISLIHHSALDPSLKEPKRPYFVIGIQI
jgi:hypothetical protein